ncbi:hypothetical protein cypCar_00029688 [Cyprinus carpio]|nr:hypothetical protein cypCar_00029688 [Cyprinus carpio]
MSCLQDEEEEEEDDACRSEPFTLSRAEKRKTPSPPHPPSAHASPQRRWTDMMNWTTRNTSQHVRPSAMSVWTERQKNKKIMDLLEAIKQKTVTLDTLRYATDTSTSVSGQPNMTSPSRRGPGLQTSAQQSLARPKDQPPGLNGVKLPVWERINSEEFVQHFHQSVLQSTQISQQKQKDGANEQFEPPALPPPALQRAINTLPNGQSNGHSCQISAQRDSPGMRNDFSAEEGVSSDEDEEEESFSPRWKGIESIFEAYEEYMQGPAGTEAQSGTKERSYAGRTGAHQEMFDIAVIELAQRILQETFTEVTVQSDRDQCGLT